MLGGQSILSMVKHWAEDTKRTAYTVLGSFVLTMVVMRVALTFAFRLHWSLGVLLATTFTVFAVLLMRQVKRPLRYADPSSRIGALVLGPTTVVAVCASISYTLHLAHPGVYAVPATYSAGTFVDSYILAFLDLLPGIKVLETLCLKNPVQAKSFIAGLPVLGFKVFVVWLFFDAFRSWLKHRKDVPTAS